MSTEMDCKVLLIVDEDERTMQLLERGLGPQYQVRRVPHGQRAIELAQKGRIALAVVSQCLPDMDGLEVLRNLHNRCPYLPVIFVPEVATKECVISAFRSGANDVLERPLDANGLKVGISRVLKFERGQDETSENGRYATCGGVQKLFVNILKDRIILNSCWFRRLIRFLKPSNIKLSSRNEQIEQDPNQKIEKSTDQGSTARLQVYCLGRFQAIVNDRAINHWPSRKGKAVFAYLVYNHKRRSNRQILVLLNTRFCPKLLERNASWG